MSDPEEVQQFLIGKMRTIGKVKNDNGSLSLAGSQVDALVSAFQQRYEWKDDKTNAKALLKKILQGKDGMFMGGDVDLSADVGSIHIQYVKDIYDARIEKAKALVDVSNGVKKATDEVSDATRRGADAAKDATEATKGQTDAIKAQEAEVMRRKAALDKMNEEYEQANKKLKDMRQRYASLPSSGADAALAKAQLKDEIDDYNENVVKKARADKNRLKKLWEKSVSDLTKMMGISTEETQKSTAAQNQETEAVEKGAKSRGRKKKTLEDTTQAVKEEAKAEGDAAKQQEQLSEQDQKRIALEQKKQELEAKRGQKIDEITKKEEDAADPDIARLIIQTLVKEVTLEKDQDGVHCVRMTLPAGA
jgi:chromosome segregation ATPase